MSATTIHEGWNAKAIAEFRRRVRENDLEALPDGSGDGRGYAIYFYNALRCIKDEGFMTSDFRELPCAKVVEVGEHDYDGRLLLVAHGYSSYDSFVATVVSYGSCSVCDALEAAEEADLVEREKMIFALTTHMVQRAHVLD